MNERFAVYFVPAPESELARFGAAVLGRDARACPVAAPEPDYAHRISNTVDAQRYGFHATLKAPFELLAGCEAESLCMAVEAIAHRHDPIVLHALAPARIRDFIALCFAERANASVQLAEAQVNALADDCLEALEEFRGPMSSTDLSRRLQAPLDKQQRQWLECYGYPHVKSYFRFHMTLGHAGQDPEGWLSWLEQLHGRCITEPPVLDRLAVCHQLRRDEPFRELSAWPLGTSSSSGKPI